MYSCGAASKQLLITKVLQFCIDSEGTSFVLFISAVLVVPGQSNQSHAVDTSSNYKLWCQTQYISTSLLYFDM